MEDLMKVLLYARTLIPWLQGCYLTYHDAYIDRRSFIVTCLWSRDKHANYLQ